MRERKEQENIIEMKTEKFSDFVLKTLFYNLRQWIIIMVNKKKSKSRHMIFKILKVKDKVKAAKEKNDPAYIEE